jgi:hypothetical protein
VFDIVFPDANLEEVNSLWKEALKKTPEDKDKDKGSVDED